MQQLQGSKYNTGPMALKNSFRNSFKNATLNDIYKLITNTKMIFRLGIYNSAISSILTGW